MKSYVCSNHIRLVGKVWEVKHSLQALVEQAGGTLKLTDYLNGLSMTTPPDPTPTTQFHLVK